MMSPSDDYDIPKRWIVTRRPSLLIFGHRVSPSWLVPALQLSESARSGVLSEAFGAGVVLGQLFVAALGARPQSHRRILPSPARFRQPGHAGGALAAAEVSWAGKPQPGELGGFPSGGTWAFLPPLPGPASDRGLSSFSSVTAAAAAPVSGSSSTSPAPPSPPQHVESMATDLDNRCPICLDSWEEASYVMPCLHQFCYACIVRWAESKPECPLCKRRIVSIVHSVRADDDFEEDVLTPSAASSVVGRQAGGAPSRPAAHSPAPTEGQPVGTVPRAPVGGLHPSTWASLFRDHPALLQPLLTWVRQELGVIFGTWSSRAAIVEDLVMPLLVLFGLDEDLLVQLLGASLQNRAATFVHQLIDVAVQRCGGEARRLLGLEDGHAAGGREGSPVAAPGTAASRGGSPTPGPVPSDSPEGTNADDLPSTSAAALRGGPGSPPSAPIPIPGEQEEPQEEPEEAMARPSTSTWGREHSPGGPRRPPKRRAGSPEASSPAKKRPPRRQH